MSIRIARPPGMAIAALCVFGVGCSAGPRLADGSRLPQWFGLPSGTQRTDVSVIIERIGQPPDSPFNIRTGLTTRAGNALAWKLGYVGQTYNSNGEQTNNPFLYPYFEVVMVGDVAELIKVRLDGTFVVVDESALRNKTFAAEPRLATAYGP